MPRIPVLLICSVFLSGHFLKLPTHTFPLLTLVHVFANIQGPEEGCWMVRTESGGTVLITVL